MSTIGTLAGHFHSGEMSVLSSRIPPNLSPPPEQRSRRPDTFQLGGPGCTDSGIQGDCVIGCGGGAPWSKAALLGGQHYVEFCQLFVRALTIGGKARDGAGPLPTSAGVLGGDAGRDVGITSPAGADREGEQRPDQVAVRINRVQLALQEEMHECIARIQSLDFGENLEGDPLPPLLPRGDDGRQAQEDHRMPDASSDEFVNVADELSCSQSRAYDYSRYLGGASPDVSEELSLSPGSDASCPSPSIIPEYYQRRPADGGAGLRGSGHHRNLERAQPGEGGHRQRLSRKLYQFVDRFSSSAALAFSSSCPSASTVRGDCSSSGGGGGSKSQQPSKSPSEAFRDSLVEASYFAHSAGRMLE